MHLKSLTLKGFKSFASATTLHFEPGITCVVGPNGAGKSNVVDALAWVLGEQGARTLRGGSMADVIFAGTADRPPLGRAEVSVTIDNTDGALPIAYTEITISRTMFRGGGSEYALNGSSCRLLDIQELLSDSGIGREMHVIVGQGQLDAILSASPEERRGFIEEAAGVLKHRKRKDKALRKLEAMSLNLTRLQDLTAELRRQLAPLGRQADVARRAASVAADVRDARLRLLADDLVQLTTTLEQQSTAENTRRALRAEKEQLLITAQHREAMLTSDLHLAAPALAAVQETWYRLSAVQERLRGTASLAAERSRLLAHVQDPRPGPHRSAEDLQREAESVQTAQTQLVAEVEMDRLALAAAVQRRAAVEAELATEDRRLAAALRAAADRREGLARLSGQAGARRSRVEAGEDELSRLGAALAEATARADAAQSDMARLELAVAGFHRGEKDLDAAHEDTVLTLAAAVAAVEALHEQQRRAEHDRATLTARREALELGLARDGAGALLASSEGVLGSVAALVSVAPGAETAVAVALGAAADAVAVASLDHAVTAIGRLKAEDAGRAGLLIGSVAEDAEASAAHPRGVAPTGASGGTHLPDGASWALDLIEAPPRLRGALAGLLQQVVVADGLATARAVVAGAAARGAHLVAVTRDGDLLGAGFAAGGSGRSPTRLEVQAAVDEAEEGLRDAVGRIEGAGRELGPAIEAQAVAQAQVNAALDLLNRSDAKLAALGEQLAQLGSVARGATAEADRLIRTIAVAEQALAADRAALEELEIRLAAAETTPGADDEDPRADQRDRLTLACTQARQAELEVRLALRTREERAHALAGRADALHRAAAQEREARAREAARAEQRARSAEVAAAVAAVAGAALERVGESLAAASQERAAAQAARDSREHELQELRSQTRALAAELEQLVDSVHRDEVARAEQRLRIEALRARSLDELGVDPDLLIEEYGPQQPVPGGVPGNASGSASGSASGAAPGPPGQTRPYDRAEQEKRLRRAARDLAELGRVNPLALEEFAALEERHRFLSTQLEDLRATRRDLLNIIGEVDERVEQVFTAAFRDTAAQFEGVFARLFPGGEGRLVLTDPGDMLTTGIEIEARPPGKKVKRLSLLSGGERSLTAVALLVAIFKARPSPFYVMDEVEAALDDTNLGRLLVLLEELRESSQLVVITHQKRTMEVADALYGVTMSGDGVTTVISQRLREPASA